jgi:RNase P/RNase MRP subunit p30
MRLPPRPILFIHGERDSYIPVEQSRLLYALATQPKFLWVVRGAKHNQSVDFVPREYAHRTVDFFDRYLARTFATENMYNERRFAEVARSELAGSGRTMPREAFGEASGPVEQRVGAPN